MSASNHLSELLSASNELDKRLARRIGQHIDKQASGLSELRDIAEAKALAPATFEALPSGNESDFLTLKINELKAIATRMNLPGRSKPKRKADIIKFLCSHSAPLAPSYEQLLNFWVENR